MEIFRKIFLFLADTIQTLLIAFAVFIVIYQFLFRPFQVNGQSMFPTFHNGEYVLTNLIGLRFSDLKRGDVVVFEAPRDREKDFIKRVIGLPGDSLTLRNGSVYINGAKLDEHAYLSDDVKTYGGATIHDDQPITVPPGQYIALGDNRPFSSDSREWGFVSRGKIIGTSLFVYWPPTRARIVKNPFEK